MNKLNRECVKNNFKWIYVQATSSKPWNRWPWCCYKLHLLFLPQPVLEKTGCRRARKEKALYFALVDTTLPEPTLLHLFNWQGTPGLSVALGTREVRESRGCQEMCVCGFCLTFPGSLLSVLWSPNVHAMKTTLGMHSSPLPPRPTAWSMVAAAANSFSEEAQRRLRKYCPHHLPDSTTVSFKFSEKQKMENYYHSSLKSKFSFWRKSSILF